MKNHGTYLERGRNSLGRCCVSKEETRDPEDVADQG